MKNGAIGLSLALLMAGSASFPAFAQTDVIGGSTHYPKAKHVVTHKKTVKKAPVAVKKAAPEQAAPNMSANPTAPEVTGVSDSSPSRQANSYESKLNLDSQPLDKRTPPGYIDPIGRSTGPSATTGTVPSTSEPAPASYQNPMVQPPAAVPSQANQTVSPMYTPTTTTPTAPSVMNTYDHPTPTSNPFNTSP